MKKSVSVYEENLAQVRVGKASAAVLQKVTVDYYGTPTPIKDIAQIKTTDAHTLTIQPWDMSLLKAAEKAILAANLGMTPQNDGKTIRLSFPQPTGERRKEMTKQVAKMGEDVKVSIRNIRRDANDQIKKMKKDSKITEDDMKLAENELQKATDAAIKDADKLSQEKEKEIMSV